MEEIFLFVNPIAGRGRARAAALRIEQRLRVAGFVVRAFVEPPHQIEQEKLTCSRSTRAVICIGGDGTLRATVDRLVACNPGRRVPPIVVIPFGTANLMARQLGLRWDEESVDRQALDAILHGSIRQIDAADANGRLFLLMAGVGIDAHIIHELEQMRSGPIDLMSYMIPSIRALRDFRYAKLTIELDGKRVFGPRPGVAFVGNVKEYGTMFPILPHAQADDDALDLCALPCDSRAEAIRLFLLAAVGEHLSAEGVVYLKGRRVRIESDQPVPMQIDGEAAGFTPLTVQLLPTKVPFIVPNPT